MSLFKLMIDLGSIIINKDEFVGFENDWTGVVLIMF